MPEARISDLFQIKNRFLRSAHLEKDFADPKALSGYVLTPQAHSYVSRLSAGLSPNSSQRAWRITGDFGSGKSSFALLVAHLFSGKNVGLSPYLRQSLDLKKIGAPRPQLLPILVTGSREPLAVALLRSLRRDLLNTCGQGRRPVVIEKIQTELDSASGAAIPDESVIRFLTEANAYITSTGKGSGLLIILDELGKFLEYAALHPDRQDVFLLQSLAEAASRSGKSPIFVVGLLHQGFNAYADQLSQSAQKEWEKVAGRFDELLFNQPLDQTANLVADALNVRIDRLPRGVAAQVRRDMGVTLDLNWYGAAFSRGNLLGNAVKLYPLHTTVLPALVRLFSRFGQNERSLFSFLLSNEPFGLQDFARRPAKADHFYRIHNLYDYARATFGHRLSLQSYRSHWSFIDSLIESFPADSETDLQVLKSVGLLNLLDANNLLPSEEAIVLAVAGDDAVEGRRVKTSIKKLQRDKHVLYDRGVAGGYCLWPHTSVNLDRALDDAVRSLGQTPQRISTLIHDYFETRPLVARRHYIETGNLRHFEVRFSPVEKLAANSQFSLDSADGGIIVALCETEEERQEALRFGSSSALAQRPEILFAVPSPLRVLAKLVQEVQKWEWVATNTPELNNDPFAAEEVARQVAASRQLLEERVHSFIGLQRFTGGTELQWFRRNKPITINSGRELLSYLSDVCDEVYSQAPKISNELVNRRSLSSAAAAARMRLIEGIFSFNDRPYLGMDPAKKPPEMSVYLSILKEGNIHRDVGGGRWALAEPDAKNDFCNVRPALRRIQQILESRADSRVKVSEIFAQLRRPPYGVRDGISPMLLAVFAIINEQHIAFYDNGAFMREMVGLDLMRLTKVPENFEIQYCKIAGVRSELFSQLFKILELKPSKKSGIDLLDIVRPLCVFAAQLPPYTHKTRRVSANAAAVRSALLSAKEPATLLFRELPQACGFDAFPSDDAAHAKEVKKFVRALKNALDELRIAYPELQGQMKTALAEAFEASGHFQEVRDALSRRAENILIAVKEPRLKAFCMRLTDRNLPEAEWLESLGSLVCSMPPAKWTDTEVEKYEQELSQLCERFQRVESIAFTARKSSDNESALRVSITKSDGSEIDNVIYVMEGEEERVAEIEEKIVLLLGKTERVGLAAAARAFWKVLSQKGERANDYTGSSHS